jgi:RIO kinase 1
MTKEKFKTFEGVFDNFTNRTLFELTTKGYFEGLESPISIGKESHIFTALTEKKRIIIKIFRLETADFNRMYEYIRTDPRFLGLKKQRRKIVFAWCQREYRNLLNVREAGVPAPTPFAFKNNVLLEEFIGDQTPAPQLKDQYPKNPQKFFDEIIKNMKKLYQHNLTHGDLSAFNILNYKEKPVFIDLSHTTTKKNSRFQELLERDLKVICQFFNKKGLKVSYETTLKKILK